MVRPSDKVIAALRDAKGVGDVASALAQDPILVVGIVVVLAIAGLFIRIYLWPHINPFKFKWVQDTKAAVEKKLTPADKEYPFAKVIYPTYR